MSCDVSVLENVLNAPDHGTHVVVLERVGS
jgi:hypothetical protein